MRSTKDLTSKSDNHEICAFSFMRTFGSVLSDNHWAIQKLIPLDTVTDMYETTVLSVSPLWAGALVQLQEYMFSWCSYEKHFTAH